MAEGLIAAAARLERFHLIRQTGRDHICIEYDATDMQTKQPVTVREYHPDGVAHYHDGAVRPLSPDTRELFERGMERFIAQHMRIARLEHPGVARVLETMQETGTTYAIVERSGERLSQWLSRCPVLEHDDVMQICGQLLNALESLHAADMPHLRMSPDAIAVPSLDAVQIVGFGSPPLVGSGSRRTFQSSTEALSSRIVAGYSPLEQYSNQGREGNWTDIYAAAAILYRCVTGDAPHDAPGRAINDELPSAVRAADSSRYGRRLLVAIDTALSLSVSARPQSILAWRILLPPLSVTRPAPNAPVVVSARGRFGARQFHAPHDAAMPLQARSEKIARIPLVSARAPMASSRQQEDTHRVRWRIPAAAALVFIGGLTWLDAGVMRSDSFRAERGIALAAAPEPTPLQQSTRDISLAAARPVLAAPIRIGINPSSATVRLIRDGNAIPFENGASHKPGDYLVHASGPSHSSYATTFRHGTSSSELTIELPPLSLWEPFVDALLIGGEAPEMIVVAPGTVRLGCLSDRECLLNELPIREVAIAPRFAIGRYEVSVGEYNIFARHTNRRQIKPMRELANTAQPASAVSWTNATSYTEWLTEQAGRVYRLPNESEWEYAARAGTETAFSWGNTVLNAPANCVNCVATESALGPVKVGSYAPNAWGLYDMHGNVWEWTADCSEEYAVSASCAMRMRRGGSWAHSLRRARSASRNAASVYLKSLDTGFRVLAELQPPEARMVRNSAHGNGPNREG